MGVSNGASAKPSGGQTNQAPKVVSSVSYLVKPKPTYPRAAKMRGESGTVIVRVHISTAGTVKSATLRQALPYDSLNDAALRAVRRARFKPYSENGVPRDSIADIPIVFQ
ncbi:MAG TPA: hypothetical protein DD666_11895 [Advenella kashmirensis]|uniref:TonB C-terminal domain-containing protein n=1 Tax=Advenella kashmirensis TaxID=310575 RepID=A0A356LHW5_9BURK|nr:hypothetical protein [Advenella kashmirensis]